MGTRSGSGGHCCCSARLGHCIPRRDRRQRRPAVHRRGLRCEPLPAAVDHQRIPAVAGQPDPARRVAGRPVRPSPGVRDRDGLVRRCLAAVRAGPQRRGADRSAGAPRRRRRPAHSGQPRDDRGRLRARGPGAGDRRLVRADRHLGRGRAVPRRRSRAVRRLALDLPDQPADRGAHRVHRRARRTREPRPERLGSFRHPGGGAGHLGPGRGDVRAHRMGRGHAPGSRSWCRSSPGSGSWWSKGGPASRCWCSGSSATGPSAPPTS